MFTINQHEDPAEANEARAIRASAAVDAYMGDDEEFYLHDLICDLGHWLHHYPDSDRGKHTSLVEAFKEGVSRFETELHEETLAQEALAALPRETGTPDGPDTAPGGGHTS